MDVRVNVDVYCADGLCGRSTRVIVDRNTEQVTDVVVKEKRPPNAERIVPVGWIVESSPQAMRVSGTADELAVLDDFVERRFAEVAVPALEPAPNTYMLQYYAQPMLTETELVSADEERLRPGQVTLEKGSHVEATDGRVGRVDEFIVNPDDGHISHIVLKQGHLFGQKEISIPVSEIDRIDTNVVYLRLSKDAIDKLPEGKVGR